MTKAYSSVIVDLGEFTKHDDILICLKSGKFIKAEFVRIVEDDEDSSNSEVNVVFGHEGWMCSAAIPFGEISFVATVL